MVMTDRELKFVAEVIPALLKWEMRSSPFSLLPRSKQQLYDLAEYPVETFAGERFFTVEEFFFQHVFPSVVQSDHVLLGPVLLEG